MYLGDCKHQRLCQVCGMLHYAVPCSPTPHAQQQQRRPAQCCQVLTHSQYMTKKKGTDVLQAWQAWQERRCCLSRDNARQQYLCPCLPEACHKLSPAFRCHKRLDFPPQAVQINPISGPTPSHLPCAQIMMQHCDAGGVRLNAIQPHRVHPKMHLRQEPNSPGVIPLQQGTMGLCVFTDAALLLCRAC